MAKRRNPNRGLDDEASDWLRRWIETTSEKEPRVSDYVIAALTPYVPLRRAILYRGGLTPDFPKAQLKSWTHARELAESIVEYDPKRKFMKKMFYPSEVLVDITALPQEWFDEYGLNEVIVAYGDTRRRMERIRGKMWAQS